jgi:hypothetical protein
VPRVGSQGAKSAAESGRVGVVAAPGRERGGTLRIEIPRSPSYSRESVGAAKPSSSLRAKTAVASASRTYLTLGGSKSIERLKQFEWL